MRKNSVSDFEFTGVKLALIYRDKIVVIRRDNNPNIPYPDMYDVTGGTREGNETPMECAFREAREELNLSLTSELVIWMKNYSDHPQGYFMVCNIERYHVDSMRLGNEGQYISLMDLNNFLKSENVVPFVKARLNDYITS
ncbi:8-oxo-dGTP diphosphatase [Izhakiella capsodis]|uniref:8-oxo-dGTP diphosphatase n=1 Tax=Izhakiella capsodis TaxID=1367852 RepID=A0A1I4X275_9GAMM|nr:NUDIX hydrolase [Izhakiella capsodis]SFN20178.1 8-oxo-dGTP diphosphatase [Izhakiella capsodis]